MSDVLAQIKAADPNYPCDVQGRLADWLLRKGRLRRTTTSLIGGFARRARDYGLPLWRMTYIVQTLHPLDRVAIMTWREDRERTEERRASHGTERGAIFLDSP
ncbi:MAG: hypothetical protein FJX47_08860, partial [Alphaproteobacteria bacterium]|nr:hypothetical protein [Alphaproteobacteria bacterium]